MFAKTGFFKFLYICLPFLLGVIFYTGRIYEFDLGALQLPVSFHTLFDLLLLNTTLQALILSAWLFLILADVTTYFYLKGKFFAKLSTENFIFWVYAVLLLSISALFVFTFHSGTKNAHFQKEVLINSDSICKNKKRACEKVKKTFYTFSINKKLYKGFFIKSSKSFIAIYESSGNVLIAPYKNMDYRSQVLAIKI